MKPMMSPRNPSRYRASGSSVLDRFFVCLDLFFESWIDKQPIFLLRGGVYFQEICWYGWKAHCQVNRRSLVDITPLVNAIGISRNPKQNSSLSDLCWCTFHSVQPHIPICLLRTKELASAEPWPKTLQHSDSQLLAVSHSRHFQLCDDLQAHPKISRTNSSKQGYCNCGQLTHVV